MILASSMEFEKGHNNEVQERPSDNFELPEVSVVVAMCIHICVVWIILLSHKGVGRCDGQDCHTVLVYCNNFANLELF